MSSQGQVGVAVVQGDDVLLQVGVADVGVRAGGAEDVPLALRGLLDGGRGGLLAAGGSDDQ